MLPGDVRKGESKPFYRVVILGQVIDKAEQIDFQCFFVRTGDRG